MVERSAGRRVAAVVVAWRDLGATIDAVKSLLDSTIPLDPVVCIAQQLSPGDLARLAPVMEGHDLVTLDDNVGFAAAVNLGISRARAGGATWVLVMNNDATAAPTCVERCLEEVDRSERIAAVGPAVVYAHDTGRLWFAGAAQSRALAIVWHRGYFAKASRPPPSADCDYVPGCCVLVSLAAWDDVGPLREDYFMYYEDAEWGERARSAGWRLRYLGEVLCVHAMAASTGEGGSRYLNESTAYYLARNPLRYAREAPTTLLRVSRTLGILTIWTAYNLTRIKPAEWKTVGRACAEGMRDGWLGRMGRRGTTVAASGAHGRREPRARRLDGR